MGVCIEERPVMHWHQSARFLGPPRERSPDLSNACQINSNNNNLIHRTCISCTDTCEHNNSKNNNLGTNPLFNESCQGYETPDRLIVDRPNYYTDLNRSDCSDNSTSLLNNCLQLKSEPVGGPSSPESSNDHSIGLDDCAGCEMPIQDRFYLSAVERKWHAGCLQCCICRQPLEGETSCFSRDGNIYCKSDYYRVFGSRRCSKCLASISSSELVMRARHLVFHIRCFSCAVCNTPLNKGDHFGIRDSAVFCRQHFELTLDNQTNLPLSMQCQFPSPYGTSPNAPHSPNDTNSKLNPNSYFQQHNVSGLPQQPRQKGRPRKRKPKDIEAMTANLDLNTEYLDLGFSRGLGSSSRAKRMRTSFKHHQLRTMKSYFAINHNPDAKDLKQLSQKTGLPKRVLQVWFQNARAKWRRMMMKQEGKIIDSDKGDGSLDLDGYVSHSPTSYIMGGPNSPASLD